MDVVVLSDTPRTRSVSMSNDDWMLISGCLESCAGSFRAQYSQVVATYVTRGQIDEAVAEAAKMNELLQRLDSLQAKLFG